MQSASKYYIVELHLVVNDQQNRFLDKAFDFGRMIYNATLGTALGQLQQMRESKEWAKIKAMPKGDDRNKAMAAIYNDYHLSDYHLRTIANNHRKASGRNDIGSHEAQHIAKNVWKALERYIFKGGGRPKFKSALRGINSIEGGDIHDIKFKPELNSISWRKQLIKVLIPDTAYMREALASDKKVKFCRIVKRKYKGKLVWNVQVCVAGDPPVRKIYADCSKVMGIDPGPSEIAYFSEQRADKCPVAPNVDMKYKEIRVLYRAIERSRRATNPNNYNPDGTCKGGKLTWVISNRCKKLLAKLAEYFRCLAETRKRDHGQLINELLQIAGTIKVEDNNYRAFQRCFGRSSTRSGMGSFFDHLNARAEHVGCQVKELDAFKLKMSQYDPATNKYTKKPLGLRWHRWGESDVLVQRDLMSAFLACYATDNGHDRELLLKKWPKAYALLNAKGFCRIKPLDKAKDSKPPLASASANKDHK